MIKISALEISERPDSEINIVSVCFFLNVCPRATEQIVCAFVVIIRGTTW